MYMCPNLFSEETPVGPINSFWSNKVSWTKEIGWEQALYLEIAIGKEHVSSSPGMV